MAQPVPIFGLRSWRQKQTHGHIGTEQSETEEICCRSSDQNVREMHNHFIVVRYGVCICVTCLQPTPPPSVLCHTCSAHVVHRLMFTRAYFAGLQRERVVTFNTSIIVPYDPYAYVEDLPEREIEQKGRTGIRGYYTTIPGDLIKR